MIITIQNPTGKRLRVTTSAGCAFILEPGKSRTAPDYVAHSFVAKGASWVCNGRLEDAVNAPPAEPAEAPEVEVVSDDEITDAVALLVDAGDPYNFTKAGAPKVDSVAGLLSNTEGLTAKRVADAFAALPATPEA